jgi:hypothetical protein
LPGLWFINQEAGSSRKLQRSDEASFRQKSPAPISQSFGLSITLDHCRQLGATSWTIILLRKIR